MSEEISLNSTLSTLSGSRADTGAVCSESPGPGCSLEFQSAILKALNDWSNDPSSSSDTFSDSLTSNTCSEDDNDMSSKIKNLKLLKRNGREYSKLTSSSQSDTESAAINSNQETLEASFTDSKPEMEALEALNIDQLVNKSKENFFIIKAIATKSSDFSETFTTILKDIDNSYQEKMYVVYLPTFQKQNNQILVKTNKRLRKKNAFLRKELDTRKKENKRLQKKLDLKFKKIESEENMDALIQKIDRLISTRLQEFKEEISEKLIEREIHSESKMNHKQTPSESIQPVAPNNTSLPMTFPITKRELNKVISTPSNELKNENSQQIQDTFQSTSIAKSMQPKNYSKSGTHDKPTSAESIQPVFPKKGILGLKIPRAFATSGILKRADLAGDQKAENPGQKSKEVLPEIGISNDQQIVEINLNITDSTIVTIDVLEAIAKEGKLSKEEICISALQHSPLGNFTFWAKVPARATASLKNTKKLQIKRICFETENRPETRKTFFKSSKLKPRMNAKNKTNSKPLFLPGMWSPDTSSDS